MSRLRWSAMIIPGVLLAGWIAAARRHAVDTGMAPSPLDVLRALHALLADGLLTQALLASLARAAVGVAIGSSIGIACGVLLGLTPMLRLVLGPSLQAAKHVSLYAWIPLIMVWFGLGESSKIVFIALAAFFPVFVNTLDGVAGFPLQWAELARIYRYSRWQIAWKLVLPAVRPAIFTGAQLSLLYGWFATLAAEYMLTSGVGMGNLLADARDDLRVDRLLALALVVALVGVGVTRLARWLEVLGRVG